jgi:uncharacterized protein YjbI with pentapeptide repeats
VPFDYIVDQDTAVAGAQGPDFPRLEGDDVDEVDAIVLDDDGELTRTRVVGGRHAGDSFCGARLTDVEFVRCDLAGCDFSDTKLTRVSLIDCRAIALEAGQSSWRDVRVVDAVLGEANLRMSTLRDVWFESTSLVAAEFIAARLEKVAFGASDLTRADFTKATCSDVDLHDARLDELRGVASLAGATIAVDQLFGLAPALASALGIVVVARDEPVQSPPPGGAGGE